jgi:hypothetical protein
VSRALAVPEDGRLVTVCCGGHRPASNCGCCAECTTNAEVGRTAPEARAAEAADDRNRAVARRLSARRAKHAVITAALDDCLRGLCLATAHAVAVLPYAESGHLNRWFSQSGVLTADAEAVTRAR